MLCRGKPVSDPSVLECLFSCEPYRDHSMLKTLIPYDGLSLSIIIRTGSFLGLSVCLTKAQRGFVVPNTELLYPVMC